MKRWSNFVIFVLFFIFISTNISAETTGATTITGETVTGEVTTKEFNIGIVITTPPPTLTILSPENETYLTNISLLLNYSVSGEDNMWYRIDSGNNTTITSATYFNTSQGGHTLYLFANNTWGTTERNVSFTVNSTRFIILYNEYNDTTRGNSTEFINYTYEDLQNLSSIVLENTDWGKIEFNEVINVTDDANISDNEVDLDTNTNISENRIELNSTAIPNFNKSATLYLYNLTLSNPRILRDGGVCPSTICTGINYTGGALKTLKFDVTQFTVYRAEETPAEGPTPPGGGGGIPRVKNFVISKEEIEVSLKQGRTKTKTINIKNTGNSVMSFVLENPLSDFIKISNTSFNLNVGESKTIALEFFAEEDAIPDLYIGKLIVRADGLEKEVLISIEIETRGPLFDVRLNIPYRSEYVLPGEEVSGEIELFNLGEGSIDVSIDYIIKDEEGNGIISEQETITVETKKEFVKNFLIPAEAMFGRYIFYVRVTYADEVASASVLFNVGERPFFKKRVIWYTVIIALVITIFFIVIYKIKKKKRPIGIHRIRKIKKHRKPLHRIDEHVLAKRKLIKR
jgi:hypothetical protein